MVAPTCPAGLPRDLHTRALCPCWSGDRCGAADWLSADGQCKCPRGTESREPGRFLTAHEEKAEEPQVVLDPECSSFEAGTADDLAELSRQLLTLSELHSDSFVRGWIRSASRSVESAARRVAELETRGKPRRSAERRARLAALARKGGVSDGL